jgi:hypothetical protein
LIIFLMSIVCLYYDSRFERNNAFDRDRFFWIHLNFIAAKTPTIIDIEYHEKM